ncbi:MAG: preprotein translocase subunit YajC [Bacillota bacterium]
MAGILGSVLPIAVVFGIFWFLVIRPQKKRQEEREDMLSGLKVGDEIVTIGGIKGEIKAINDDSLKLKVASDVKIEVTKQSIGRVQNSEKNNEPSKTEE